MSTDILAGPDAEIRIPWVSPKIFASIAVVLALAVVGAQMAPRANRSIATIRVDGAFTHLSSTQLAAATVVAPGTGLFDVDLNAVRNHLEALPWVAHAEVARLWPDTLVIRVDERVAVAHWGDDALLDSEGRSFTPPAADLKRDLPLLSGPDESRGEVWAAYRALADALAGGPLALAAMSLDARGEWAAQTQSGIALRLGQGDPAAHASLLTGAVLRSLRDKLDTVAYLDLRYPNGFAVGWRNGTTTKPVSHPATVETAQ